MDNLSIPYDQNYYGDVNKKTTMISQSDKKQAAKDRF